MGFSPKQRKGLMRYTSMVLVPCLLSTFIIFKEGRVLGYTIGGLAVAGFLGLIIYYAKQNKKND